MHQSIKQFVLSFSLLLMAQFALAQKGNYEVKVKVRGLPVDSNCYLAHYYGETNSVKDTAKVGKNGWVVFKGNKTLPEGIYLFVTYDRRFFEFIITNQQHFSLETDTSGFAKSMKVTGNDESKLFYEYLQFLAKVEEKAKPVAAAYTSLMTRQNEKDKNDKPVKRAKKEEKNISDSLEIVKKLLTAVDEDARNYKKELIKKYPNSFVSKIFIYSKDPEVPEAPTLANGRKDSTFAYRYFVEHYFDNMDFKDERMLRTPIFAQRMKDWMERYHLQLPDSLSKAADIWIEHARANKELFKYSVAWLTLHYETSKMMGMEAVFVHLVNKYYKTGQTPWIDSTQMYKITERANLLEPILIGKRPDNFVFEDTTGKAISLYDVKAKYTVLFLYDPDCGHCRHSTPILRDDIASLDKAKYNAKVVAASVEGETDKWKKFIREFKVGDWVNLADPKFHSNFRHYFDVSSTPQIFILNDKKEIIARRIGAEQVKNVIEDYERIQENKRKKGS